MSVEAFVYVRSLRLGLPARKLILQSLADRADEAFSCYPGVPLLAAECELKPRMVQKHLAWLREHGYVSDRERFRPDGSQTSNRYYLHGPWDDYGGTGRPFEQVVYPDYQALDGAFRTGTKAAGGVYSSTPGGVYPSTSPPRTPVHGGGVLEDAPPTYSETSPGALRDAPRRALQDTPGVYSGAHHEPPEETAVEAPPPPPSVPTAEERAGARADGEQKGAASPRDLSAAAAGGTASASPTAAPESGEGAPAGRVPPAVVAMARDVAARLPRALQPGDPDERVRVLAVIAEKLHQGHPVPDVYRELSANLPDHVADKAAFVAARLKRMAPWVPSARPAADTAALAEIRERQAAQAGTEAPSTAAARAALAAARQRAHASPKQQREVGGGPADS